MKKYILTACISVAVATSSMAAVMTPNTSDSAIGLNTSDQVVFPSGNLSATLFSMGDDSTTAGKKDACGILVFQLPVLAAGELIDTADLTVEKQNGDVLGKHLCNSYLWRK